MNATETFIDGLTKTQEYIPDIVYALVPQDMYDRLCAEARDMVSVYSNVPPNAVITELCGVSVIPDRRLINHIIFGPSGEAPEFDNFAPWLNT